MQKKNNYPLLDEGEKHQVTAQVRHSKIIRGGEHPLEGLTQEQIERHNKQPINYTYK